MNEQRVSPERFHALDVEVTKTRSRAEKFSANNALQKRLGIVTIPDKAIFADHLATLAVDQQLRDVEKDMQILSLRRPLTRGFLKIVTGITPKRLEKERDALLDAQVYLIAERNDHIEQHCRTPQQRQSVALVMDALDDLFNRANNSGSGVNIDSDSKISEDIFSPWQEEWRDKLQQVG